MAWYSTVGTYKCLACIWNMLGMYLKYIFLGNILFIVSYFLKVLFTIKNKKKSRKIFIFWFEHFENWTWHQTIWAAALKMAALRSRIYSFLRHRLLPSPSSLPGRKPSTKVCWYISAKAILHWRACELACVHNSRCLIHTAI